MKRIFIVGCPRSGTTLLQSMLAGSPELLSLPESHVLRLGIGRRGTQALSVLARKSLLKSLQAQLHLSHTFGENLSYFLSQSDLIDHMVSSLDIAATAQGLSGWVEKTPEHLFYIKQIEARFPDAMFIHVVRDGRAAVASILEMWELYTREWSRSRLFLKKINDYLHAYRGLKLASKVSGKAIDFREIWKIKTLARACLLWNDSLITTKAFLKKSNHRCFRYEDITSDSAEELTKLCEFIGVNFESVMLQSDRHAAALVGSQEQWKQDNSEPIRPASLEKYNSRPQLDKQVIERLLLASGDSRLILVSQ